MSKTNTFILQGKKSFSDSKLEQLNLDFNKFNNQEAQITSSEIYILASSNEKLNLEELKNILDAEDLMKSFSFLIGPRSGTISPWSSKTEDIIKNVGAKDVDRVERFYGFDVSTFENNSNLDLSMFFDRMTQAIYSDFNDCKDFLNNNPQRSVSIIDIINGGVNSLKEANKKFGFALSQEEIDYLFNFYSQAVRNPTDCLLYTSDAADE